MMRHNISQTSNTDFQHTGHSFIVRKPVMGDGNSDDVVGKTFPSVFWEHI